MLHRLISAGCAALYALALLTPLSGLQAAIAQEKPNIILIMTDDESRSGVHLRRYLPNIFALMHDRGVSFTTTVSYPYCCPSRASFECGIYPHNHLIVDNLGDMGGYKGYKQRNLARYSIAHFLQEAGYHTAKFGKHLNNYQVADGMPMVNDEPIYDEWFVPTDEPGSSGYGNGRNSYYVVSNNGDREVFGNDVPEEYLTDVLFGNAIQTIETADKPVFIEISVLVPHAPGKGAERHDGLFSDVALPHPPNFNRLPNNVPWALQKATAERPIVEGDERYVAMEEFYQAQLRSMQAVDEGVAKLYAALARAGKADNTYIFYVSDHGFFNGEYGIDFGKIWPYPESVQVASVVTGPGILPGTSFQKLVSNVDFAPTFAELAGIAMPTHFDGRSFASLLKNPNAQWPRETVYSMGRVNEHTHEPSVFDTIITQEGMWLTRSTYESRPDDLELYNFSDDPYGLRNLASDLLYENVVMVLERRLDELMVCGTNGEPSCREVEDLPLDFNQKPMHQANASK